MKKLFLITIGVAALLHSSKAQDYFSDLSSSNTPIFLNTDGKALFSASINPGDNSIKAVFFRQYGIESETFKKANIKLDTKEYKLHYWGWGLNTSTKTTSGLGSLVSTGQFSPDFSGGGYLSYSIAHWKDQADLDKQSFSQVAFILSGTLSAAKYQFYNPANAFAAQLSDTNFNGRSISLSVVKACFPKTNNLYYGLSITASHKNNYDKLDKVEIKDDSSFNSPTGVARNVQPIKDDGYTYAVGSYQQYTNFRVQANVSFTPGALAHQFAFILYPSVDYSSVYEPIYNIGFSIAHLKSGIPSVSDAALYFQLNDLSNVAGKAASFLKRSFKLGVSATFNIFTAN